MPMDTEIARSFLDWSTDEVTKWLSTLSLSQDYSEQFRGYQITGETLIKLNPAALDELRITEGADRVKILQQITTMRADLIIDSPTRRVRSPCKPRRFSEAVPRNTYTSSNHRLQKPKLSVGTLERTLSPVKRVHTPVSPRYASYGEGASPLTYTSPDSLSPVSSGMSSPTKFRSRDGSPYEGVPIERRERELVNKLQATATLRGHNMHRLSRSLDGLLQDGEDIFSLVAKAELQENCNSRLVEILREENTTLKRDLETYYQRVRKLQKLEQEVEHIREGQRMLEASAMRREKLEASLRAKLEKQVRNLRAEIIHLKAELHKARKQDGKADTKNGEANNSSKSREIRKRDTMIVRLIKQNQESAAFREQLEKDLHSTRAQLQERAGEEEGSGREPVSDSQTERINSETERKMSRVYSQSIEKLKSVLTTMQSMSQKRERLEKHLREQLLTEIGRLKGNPVDTRTEGMKESKSELLMKIATLEADLIKWEQKCLELVAEKQMALEAAILPRDSRIEHLERSISEQNITIQELYQQKASYIAQLTDTNKKLVELETKVSSLRLTVNEKDTVIQALQHSFLDPDELSQDDHSLMGSPILHHSPVAAKKITFPVSSGAQADIDGTVSLPGDVLSNGYPGFPPSPPTKRRGIPNSTSYMGSRGHQTTNGYTPTRRYSEKSVAVGHSGGRSISPVKRASIAQPVYIMKEPPAYGSGGGGGSEYGSPNPHHGKLSYPPLPVSNSAPNSPGNRIGGGRKPRISHPNMHFLQVPNSKSSPPPSSPRKFDGSGKSNTTPGELRRNLSKPPLSPKLPNRAVKSKTPPPNYKLVSSSSSSSGGTTTRSPAGGAMSFKQRHHSVDDVLRDDSVRAPGQGGAAKDSMDLFNSLLGDNVPPQSRSEYKQALQMGVARERGTRQGHQHSKSSPSSERRNCFAYGN